MKSITKGTLLSIFGASLFSLVAVSSSNARNMSYTKLVLSPTATGVQATKESSCRICDLMAGDVGDVTEVDTAEQTPPQVQAGPGTQKTQSLDIWFNSFIVGRQQNIGITNNEEDVEQISDESFLDNQDIVEEDEAIADVTLDQGLDSVNAGAVNQVGSGGQSAQNAAIGLEALGIEILLGGAGAANDVDLSQEVVNNSGGLVNQDIDGAGAADAQVDGEQDGLSMNSLDFLQGRDEGQGAQSADVFSLTSHTGSALMQAVAGNTKRASQKTEGSGLGNLGIEEQAAASAGIEIRQTTDALNTIRIRQE